MTSLVRFPWIFADSLLWFTTRGLNIWGIARISIPIISWFSGVSWIPCGLVGGFFGYDRPWLFITTANIGWNQSSCVQIKEYSKDVLFELVVAWSMYMFIYDMYIGIIHPLGKVEQSCWCTKLSPCAAPRYYNGFANNVLWPLFHYIMSSVFCTTDTFSFLVATRANYHW